jgi:molybdopterin adenylyltransferase
MTGTVFSLNCSAKKGTRKVPQARVRLIEDRGVEGDAHAGPGIRQVSLLAIESITKQQPCAHTDTHAMTLAAGDFAENITTAGVDLAALKIGKRIIINNEIVLEVTQIGKDCHQTCKIYEKIGDCIMPREGIFAKVVKGGMVKIGDRLEVTSD